MICMSYFFWIAFIFLRIRSVFYIRPPVESPKLDDMLLEPKLLPILLSYYIFYLL